MDNEDIQWEGVSPDVVDFVFYQAERHIEAQLQSGIASDARAVSSASLLAPLAGLVLAGSFGYWIANPSTPLLAAGIVLGAVLLLAAFFCILAAKPIDFYFPGNQPAEWYGCLNEPLLESKGVEIENYQSMIEDNAAALAAAAKWLIRGISLAIASPLAFVIVYSAIYYWISCPV